MFFYFCKAQNSLSSCILNSTVFDIAINEIGAYFHILLVFTAQLYYTGRLYRKKNLYRLLQSNIPMSENYRYRKIIFSRASLSNLSMDTELHYIAISLLKNAVTYWYYINYSFSYNLETDVEFPYQLVCCHSPWKVV